MAKKDSKDKKTASTEAKKPESAPVKSGKVKGSPDDTSQGKPKTSGKTKMPAPQDKDSGVSKQATPKKARSEKASSAKESSKKKTTKDGMERELKKTARAKKSEAKPNLPPEVQKGRKPEKAERKGAKKLSRTQTDPEISAEHKMKLPNTSPSEDLSQAFEAGAEKLKNTLSPDDKTREGIKEKARDYIPDQKDIEQGVEKVSEVVKPGIQKAKKVVDDLLPDKEKIKETVKTAKETAETMTGSSKMKQKSSGQKPVEATLLSDYDIHLFREGKHYHLYNKLGSHLMNYMETEGVYFALWAPNAEKVTVIGDFNNWSRERHPMKVRQDSSGIWEVFIPEARKGSLYKYFIRSHSGYEVEKGDPFAFTWETPPNTASMVWDLENTWKDKKWLGKRKKQSGKAQPFSVYELHLGSWKRVPEDGFRSLNYRELAEDLPSYLKEMGFTHVEFMPVMEHPFFGSWGYQITGYFAPSSRFGTPQDFMYLIDRLHQEEIGVILDWVPSHFPSDLHGLHYFDGTHLYEHEDKRKGFHPDWQSYIFNYGRSEVRSFLISNALFWLDKFHADGLRVDAVASMLYLDYSRKHGEWEPNEHGGNENLEAISFLKEFNEVVYKEFPDVVTIAEESTAWPMVSKPTYIGGLGFGMKWMMGWMHDTLKYFSEDPIHRRYHQNTITFSTTYAFTENFMLPLSHDEVVYGKQAILNKMPGDTWNKFANLRTLYAYMFAHPGTKLLFMGAEFGQWSEWNHDSSLEWHLTDSEPHHQIQETVKNLNKLYKTEPALYEKSFAAEGFEWIDIRDEENSIISFIRKGEKEEDDLLVVCNFTPVPRENYRIGVPREGKWKEIFNSDDRKFGGSGVLNREELETQNLEAHHRNQSISLTIPPLGVVYLKKK